MEQYLQILNSSDQFLIVLARLSGLGFAPILNTRSIPASWKALFVIMLGFFTWNLGLADNFQAPDNTLGYVLLVAGEVTVGLAISLFVQFLFAAVQFAGEIIDIQIGFSMMNVLDPLSGTQSPLLGNFKFILALLVYLQLDGHHYLIKAIIDSYRVIPIGQFNPGSSFILFLAGFFANVLTLAVQLAIPFIATLFITDIIMGVISRTMPQMNIFLVGMPAKILLGFAVLLAIIPLYIYLLNSLVSDLIQQLNQFILYMR